MQQIRYPARDGVAVPAYVTIPSGAGNEPKPLVVLPHGGPTARDYWEFDYFVQFLAASGFVVLQPNYRGSDGYGLDWRGDGGFRDWRRAVGDITAGVEYLVRERIADERRVCAVRWSFGGYAALMSAIEQPTMFRCVADGSGEAGSFPEGQATGELPIGTARPQAGHALQRGACIPEGGHEAVEGDRAHPVRTRQGDPRLSFRQPRTRRHDAGAPSDSRSRNEAAARISSGPTPCRSRMSAIVRARSRPPRVAALESCA